MQKIFLGNLDYDISADELKIFCADHGVEVQKLKLASTRDGESRGFAFLDLCEGQTIESAIAKLHRQLLSGRFVVADFAPRRG